MNKVASILTPLSLLIVLLIGAILGFWAAGIAPYTVRHNENHTELLDIYTAVTIENATKEDVTQRLYKSPTLSVKMKGPDIWFIHERSHPIAQHWVLTLNFDQLRNVTSAYIRYSDDHDRPIDAPEDFVLDETP